MIIKTFFNTTISAVCEMFGLSREELCGKNDSVRIRKARIVLACYLSIYENLPAPLIQERTGIQCRQVYHLVSTCNNYYSNQELEEYYNHIMAYIIKH